MTQTPAGWHPDPNDPTQLRYWDGTQWTDHRAAARADVGAPFPAATVSSPVAPHVKGSRRSVWIALGAVALLVGGCAIGAAAASGGSDDDTAPSATATVTVTKDAKAAKPASPATATVTVTAEAAAAAADGGDQAEPDTADDAPAADEGTKPSSKLPKQNGDWRLDSVQFKDDGLGDFAGIARVTYSSGGDNLFTVTVFGQDAQTILATLTGSASGVKPGQTVTVEFFSFDDYKAGKLPFTFQNDL